MLPFSTIALRIPSGHSLPAVFSLSSTKPRGQEVYSLQYASRWLNIQNELLSLSLRGVASLPPEQQAAQHDKFNIRKVRDRGPFPNVMQVCCIRTTRQTKSTEPSLLRPSNGHGREREDGHNDVKASL